MAKHAVLCLLGIAAIAAAAAAAAAAADDPGAADAPPARTYPSMPADAGSGQRLVVDPGPGSPEFMPINASHYEHRRGDFTLQLPEGASNIRLQLERHEDFVFGTAFNPEVVQAGDMDWYLSTTRSLFYGLTPEDRFKWYAFEPVPGRYQDARRKLEDRYISFAQESDFVLARGHTLEWANGGDKSQFWAHKLECDAYVKALKERVTREVKLFKGKFNQYDVWNEVIESPGVLNRCNLWDTAFPDAFKWAHEADPDAQLCLNDLSLIEAHNAPKLITIIQDHLWAHGAPIHCIGIQAHFEHYGINTTYQREKLDLLAGLGLDLYITEYTLFTTWRGPPVWDHAGEWPVSWLDEATQAHTTVELFRFWFSHPAVKGIIMWGWWDATIWIPNAGIYAADKRPKQAAEAIRALWQQELTTRVAAPALPGGGVAPLRFRGFFGTYEYSFELGDGLVQRGRVHFGRDQRAHAVSAEAPPAGALQG